MEGFNNLMEDMKESLILSNQRKGIFLPALIANIAIFILGIIALVVIIASVTGTIVAAINDFDNVVANVALISSIILGILILVLIFSILFIALDIGITGLVIGAVDGEKPTASLFFSAVKRHLIPVFFTKIGLGLIILISMILWIIPFVLYLVTVGLLSGGWGMIFLTCVLNALIGFWVLIKIEDHRGGFESIGVNIQFGRSHIWLLILIFYLQINLASFLPGLLGFLGAAIASLFISYMVTTYFKIVLLMTYRRYRKEGI